MKIFSWNVNGLKSVYRKGFLEWLKKSDADIVCLQEVKVQPSQIPLELIDPLDYHTYYSFDHKKGHSGVAIFTKQKPLSVNTSIGLPRFDLEGRLLEFTYKDFILVNLYIPHGNRTKADLPYKLAVYKSLLEYIRSLKSKKLILCGDFNIAHTEIDLARPKGNTNNIMFTKEERRQIDNLLELGFIDSFRKFNKENGNYTWWPYAFDARNRNVGWRIDYIFVSKQLGRLLKEAKTHKEVSGSDHCPISIDLNLGS